MKTARLYGCILTLCSVLWFLMAILLCLATIWFRPAAILLKLDFLSLCLETRALRNIYLDHLLTPDTEEKGEKDFKIFIYFNCYFYKLLNFIL